MMRLFVTGPSRTGKTALLLSALAPYQTNLSGYYVTRHMQNGRVMAYALCEASIGEFKPDAVYNGEVEHAFLTWEGNGRAKDLAVFDGFGTMLLKRAVGTKLALLDEIGGIEMLSDAFYEALCALLQSKTPCVGVFKSVSAFERMSRDVQSVDACAIRRKCIENLLSNDTNTRLISISDRNVNKEIQAFIESIFHDNMKR